MKKEDEVEQVLQDVSDVPPPPPKKILDGPLLWAQKMVFDTILGVPISALNEASKTYYVL